MLSEVGDLLTHKHKWQNGHWPFFLERNQVLILTSLHANWFRSLLSRQHATFLLCWCWLPDKMGCTLHLSFPCFFADQPKNIGLLEMTVKWQALVEPIYEPLTFLGHHQIPCYFVVISSYQRDDIIDKQHGCWDDLSPCMWDLSASLSVLVTDPMHPTTDPNSAVWDMVCIYSCLLPVSDLAELRGGLNQSA